MPAEVVTAQSRLQAAELGRFASVAGTPEATHPSLVVFRRTTQKAVRSALLWGLIFGGYVAITALTYASQYKTVASRRAFAHSLSSSGGLNALVGPAHDLQTVAGFTAWKTLAVLAVLGAIWALLLSTKLLRGEEDAGRWELFLSGQTTRRGAAAQALGGLGVAFMVQFGLTALVIVAVGQSRSVGFSAGGGLYFAFAATAGAIMFFALGALCSQLAASRRQAAAYAGGAAGALFVLRMVADSSTSLSWLAWLTPFGWIERLAPFTTPHPVVLLPIVGCTIGAGVLAVVLAGHRDLNASIIPDRSSAQARTWLLSGNVGLTVRQVRPTVLGWWGGMAAFGLLLGAVAKEAAKSVEASPTARKLLLHFGGPNEAVKAYLGFTFVIVTALVVLVAAGQITAGRREEAEGRMEHFLVRPVSRTRWMAGRLLVGAVALAVAGVLAGIFCWLGVVSQGQHIGFSSLFGAGLNTVPAGLCLLGIGGLAWGLAPRTASLWVYGLLAWSFLVDLLAGTAIKNHWLLDTSIFHQLAAAPVNPPDWLSGGALMGIGVLAAVGGLHALARRDLAGE